MTNYEIGREGSFALYTKELEAKYRILIYSGDTDSTVSTYGTKAWI